MKYKASPLLFLLLSFFFTFLYSCKSNHTNFCRNSKAAELRILQSNSENIYREMASGINTILAYEFLRDNTQPSESLSLFIKGFVKYNGYLKMILVTTNQKRYSQFGVRLHKGKQELIGAKTKIPPEDLRNYKVVRIDTVQSGSGIDLKGKIELYYSLKSATGAIEKQYEKCLVELQK
ncbi:MAG: hypothetical protein AAF518_06185 [Spirochaetota bacterium]